MSDSSDLHRPALTMSALRNVGSLLLGLAGLTSITPASADALDFPTLGRREGEIDLDTSFVGRLGDARPGEDAATWQRADTRIFTVGAGYSVGRLGPLHDCYARVEGGFALSADEPIGAGTAPSGPLLFQADRSGLVRGFVSANVVKSPRLNLGLFLRGTAPLGLDLQKFSSVHVHLFGGGSTLDVALTSPNTLLRARYLARLFVGSGAYDGDYQHNAELQVTNLLRVEAQRWLLPWPAGIAVGPDVRADLNGYRNAIYADAFAASAPGARIGEHIQATSVAAAVYPYFHITKHVAVEAGYEYVFVGTEVQATHLWSASLRSAF
ncbi:MAG: hypothetical protein FJ095_15915 [Deltaproteobacteria bacterium]|nr:hypothetical protein [Deltaproteobacteria bacterium]